MALLQYKPFPERLDERVGLFDFIGLSCCKFHVILDICFIVNLFR